MKIKQNDKEWAAIVARLRKYIKIRKGNYTHLINSVGIPSSTVDNYIFKDVTPSFTKGRVLQKFENRLTVHDFAVPVKKVTQYQTLKQSGQLK
ncbi:MAG: hypothetical protein CMI54_06235 [Parcubacteria group bacterium]|jgi:hypothetical protein|nr:hypothetical protein [Parcubacteria group bacterium]|tara:strand:- start:19477 stop:19755 length:279 start_codon:yes stop_codon:yes gene_type:complete